MSEPAADDVGRQPRRSWSWAATLLVVVAGSFLVRETIATTFVVEGASMLPTLDTGDRVLVDRVGEAVERGDIVVFPSPLTPGRDLIKRVVAVGGETVGVDGCVVRVDGVALDEPYLDDVVDDCGGGPAAFTVPLGAVYVLGDNRERSSDSRVFGAVPVDRLVGRAVAVIWPVGRWRGL